MSTTTPKHWFRPKKLLAGVAMRACIYCGDPTYLNVPVCRRHWYTDCTTNGKARAAMNRLPIPLPLRFVIDAAGYLWAATRDSGWHWRGLWQGVTRCVYVARLMRESRRRLDQSPCDPEVRP